METDVTLSAHRCSSMGEALQLAVEQLRERAGNRHARVAIVASSRHNGEQARRALGDRIPFIGVDFLTPDHIANELGRIPLIQRDLLPEPSGWLRATLHHILPRLSDMGWLGRHGAMLCEPGWIKSVESAIHQLEAAGVDPRTLRRHIPAGTDGERVKLLAVLLEQINKARLAERLFSSEQLHREALQAITSHRPHPLQEIKGAILLGDAILSPGVFAVLQAWLASRDCVRLVIHPLEALPPAPHGLREASGPHHTIEIIPEDNGLGHLKRHLYTSMQKAPANESVSLLATPDEIREMAEAVRVVQQAIGEGTPLDRIAIVVPDGVGLEVLQSLLDKAGIPATWLTGPPLLRTPCARFLQLAMDIACGDDSVASWYELISQPGLMGNVPLVGRHRWRDLLAQCPRREGTHHIIEYLREIAESDTTQPTEPHTKSHDPSRHERLRRTADAMRRLLEELDQGLRKLPEEGQLAAFGTQLKAFLERWWVRSQDRDRVVQLLDSWGGDPVGPRTPRTLAGQLLRDTMASTAYLTGSLTQARIRVLPPMLVLGGEFDVVFIAGLSEGRFPRPIQEDYLLTDGIVALLRRQAGASLLPSDALQDVERRRLAAAIAGCRGRLWLSSPRYEMLESRPQLPSSLVLEVASALAGHRVSYSALKQLQESRGSRGWPFARNPQEAIGPEEFMIARLHDDTAQVLPILATHPVGWRQMQLHRSIDRFAQTAHTETPQLPNPWTGLISPEILACSLLQGEPTGAAALELFACDPSAYFFRHMLGVRRPSYLRGNEQRMTQYTIQRHVLEVIQEVLAHPDEPFDDCFARLWEARLSTLAEAGDLPPATFDIILEQGMHLKETFVSSDAALDQVSTAPSLEGGVLDERLPFRLILEGGHMLGGTLIQFEQSASKLELAKHFRLVARGLALAQSGVEIEAIQVSGVDGKNQRESLGQLGGKLVDELSQAQRRAEVGWWPVFNGKSPFCLGRERTAPSQSSARSTAITERLEEVIRDFPVE